MTEEDTFNMLKRPTYIEMKEIYSKWLHRAWQDEKAFREYRELLFISYGWTVAEYRAINIG